MSKEYFSKMIHNFERKLKLVCTREAAVAQHNGREG